MLKSCRYFFSHKLSSCIMQSLVISILRHARHLEVFWGLFSLYFTLRIGVNSRVNLKCPPARKCQNRHKQTGLCNARQWGTLWGHYRDTFPPIIRIDWTKKLLRDKSFNYLTSTTEKKVFYNRDTVFISVVKSFNSSGATFNEKILFHQVWY